MTLRRQRRALMGVLIGAVVMAAIYLAIFTANFRDKCIHCRANLVEICLWDERFCLSRGRWATNCLELVTDNQPWNGRWDDIMICPFLYDERGGRRTDPLSPTYHIVQQESATGATDDVIAYCEPRNHFGLGGTIVRRDRRTEWVPRSRWRETVPR